MSGTDTAGDLRAAGAFDELLGDPREADSVINTERSIDLDERSMFPVAEVQAIDTWGLQRHYVPTAYGGELHDSLVPMLMIRNLARRDVTAAVAHGKTFLGSVCSWVAGGEIAQRTADIVVTGDPVSWGLTEKGRGSDLSRSATVARLDDSGVRLDGGKWPINNATRGRAMTVLARSSEKAGPRALSLVLIDKQDLDLATISYEPKVRTHGIRGADISGIRFDGTVVDSANVVGTAGHGLEIVLKALQLTRPLTTSLSVGAADHALEIALEFAADRRLYGRRLADLPGAQRVIAQAVADTLLAESLMIVGGRTIHSAPQEMALVSALVKFLAPDTVDMLFRDLTSFLGARSQLLGVAGAGAFQKAARDNRVVGIFDGNSIVNLNVIINEFPNIVRERPAPDPESVLAPLRVDAPVGPFPADQLRLVTRHGSALLRAFPALVESIGRTGNAELVAAARFIEAEYTTLLGEIETLPRASQPHPVAFDTAERLALVFGAASALAVFAARGEDVPG
ncbi:acyl-CoA dehydrogenase family protein, partial [Microbacterium sp.]|uniref:acyl-CoA dehydrogenase family protein n=1 Tax=Microbacterium sp. TaxID=51671 RepID=UPI003C73032B